MSHPLRKVLFPFLLIVIVPVGFIFYEMGSLTDHEEIVRETYRNQLEAILFSVNQYSEDIISSWSNQVSTGLATDPEKLWTGTSLSNAVSYIYLSDLHGQSKIIDLHDSTKTEEVKKALDGVLSIKKDRVDKLMQYKSAGWTKKETMDTVLQGGLVPVFFAFDSGLLAYNLGGLVLDPMLMFQNILGPRMQAIARDQFIIRAYRTGSDSMVYSTASLVFDQSPQTQASQPVPDDWRKKELWLLPGYYLAITLNGATIDDLVARRIQKSLIILLLLLLVLAVAIVFLYRNVRRELYLTQVKSEFVANVSHEIRTPLSMISMFAETLEMGRARTREKELEYYRIIRRETERLAAMVNRILNFSRIEANKKRYQFEPLDINELCADTLESYRFQLTSQGFDFHFMKEESLPEVVADRESLGEAIGNLLDNAIKYSREQKEISLSTRREDLQVVIEVNDKGIGIPRQYQKEIFDQFYRAPTGDVHDTKGSGLGLTLVKRIMDAHQGKVEVNSFPGKGSTFRLIFEINSKKS